MVDKVSAAIAEYDYNIYGLRITDDEFEDGETIYDCSRVWIDNEITEEHLTGLSCVAVPDPQSAAGAIARASCYGGKYVYLLGADEIAEHGEDDGEVVLKTPIVLEKWITGRF